MDNDIKKEIGCKVKQLRTVKGWSRGQIADKLKMSESNYGHIERGEADIGIIRLAEIAKVFEITLSDLLGLNEKTVFSFTTNKPTVNTIGINQASNNMDNLNLQHELEKKALVIELKDKELAMQQREIAYLKELLEMHKNSKNNLAE
ncbi:MAG: hypothetical protein RL637_1754 [Pseudomonadota bacterium]|jgi:transcriptional regulator with XRE-family HTH domain